MTPEKPHFKQRETFVAAEAFTLSIAEEDELLEALAEIERGEFVTLEVLLSTLTKS